MADIKPTIDRAKIDAFVQGLKGLNVQEALKAFQESWIRTFGNVKVEWVTKTVVMGTWNVQVVASAGASTGEFLAGPPSAQIFSGDVPVRGPEFMQPWVLPGFWTYTFTGVYPEPHYALVKIALVTYQGHYYSLDDLEEIT